MLRMFLTGGSSMSVLLPERLHWLFHMDGSTATNLVAGHLNNARNTTLEVTMPRRSRLTLVLRGARSSVIELQT